jgi:hypothetical protein
MGPKEVKKKTTDQFVIVLLEHTTSINASFQKLGLKLGTICSSNVTLNKIHSQISHSQAELWTYVGTVQHNMENPSFLPESGDSTFQYSSGKLTTYPFNT